MSAKMEALGTTPDYNFFARGFVPDYENLGWFVGYGFDCSQGPPEEVVSLPFLRERQAPSLRNQSDITFHPHRYYFKAHRESQGGAFWLRISMVPDPPLVTPLQTLRVEVGDIERLQKQRNKPTFDFLPEGFFDVEYRGDQAHFHSYRDELVELERGPAFVECIARGLFWLGMPLDVVEMELNLDFNHHQKTEWQLERRDFCRFFQRHEGSGRSFWQFEETWKRWQRMKSRAAG